MAMLVIKSADTKTLQARTPYGFFQYLFNQYEPLVSAICEFEEGHLPGILEDTAEALDTGKGFGRQQLL